MPEPIHEGPKSTPLSNVLTVIGFIILLIIVVWGLVHLATLSRGWFSNLFPGSQPSIQITAPTDAVSEMPFTISWKSSATVKGSYAFLYQCQPGFKFEMTNSVGVGSGVPCGAAFSVPAASSTSVSITPILTTGTATKVPLSIVFIPATGTAGQMQGSAEVTIHPASKPSPTPTPTNTQTTPTPAPTPKAPAPATPSDLSVQIISATSDAYGNATVTFDIKNIGGSTSGTYYFTAQLPTSTNYPYSSPAQLPLSPGSHIVNTLRFSQAVSGTFAVTVGAQDRNQNNNYASQWMNVQQNYNPYVYQPTYQY